MEKVFEKFHPKKLELFNNKKTQVTYYKGETIVKQGAFANNIIFVNNGLARQFLQSGNHKQVNLRLIQSGDLVGFFSIFGDSIYPFSVVALKETTVCLIEKEAFTNLLLENPGFALEITSSIYQREHRLLDIINNLTYKQMRGKLAAALLYLSSPDFDQQDVFELLTRQDIADFASITLESAIKFIKEFEKEGIIVLESKKVKVVDREGLERISRVG